MEALARGRPKLRVQLVAAPDDLDLARVHESQQRILQPSLSHVTEGAHHIRPDLQLHPLKIARTHQRGQEVGPRHGAGALVFSSCGHRLSRASSRRRFTCSRARCREASVRLTRALRLQSVDLRPCPLRGLHRPICIRAQARGLRWYEPRSLGHGPDRRAIRRSFRRAWLAPGFRRRAGSPGHARPCPGAGIRLPPERSERPEALGLFSRDLRHCSEVRRRHVCFQLLSPDVPR